MEDKKAFSAAGFLTIMLSALPNVVNDVILDLAVAFTSRLPSVCNICEGKKHISDYVIST